MPLTIPPELKKITPFVKRAEELDRDKANPESRLVAYYCRQYAVQLGIGLATSPAGKECLGVILGQLEGEKAAMSNFTREESKYLCKAFADKIFDKADAEDRAGVATKNTAKTFYAAATFFEMLQQFNEGDQEGADQEEERNKTVYSKWKATEILKAIKEGRQPTPGGYGESDNEKEEEEEDKKGTDSDPEQNATNGRESEMQPEVGPATESEDDDAGTEVELLGPPPEYPGESSLSPEVFVDDRPPIAPPAMQLPPAPSVAPPPLPSPPAPAPAPEKSSWFGKKKKNGTKSPRVSNEALEDATELTKFALSALQNKDVDLAASRLQQALEALGR